MAAIVKDMTPESDNDGGVSVNTQIIIHAPAIRAESDYIEGQIVSID